MSRAFLSPRTWPALAPAMILLALVRPAPGQMGGQPPLGLKSPVAHQVVQRDANGVADVPVTFPDDLKEPEVVNIGFIGWATPARFEEGKYAGVPAGGPYSIQAQVKTKDKGVLSFESGPFFVGDLWVLAGQSNMEGVGDLVDVTPGHSRVMALGMDGRWTQAKEPLHWLVDSPDPVHSGDPATRAKRSSEGHKARTKGAGLGLPFGLAMASATNVPVGLVACAHGGTSMAEWSPSKRGEGGKSLYGSMLRQVKLAGGKVKGVLWYQGESDCFGGRALADAYAKTFADFIGEVRKDLDQPELPFYFVQIGRFIGGADPAPWNAVRDAQRRLADLVPAAAVVSVIDLELDDLIHVGTLGLKRVGLRLARIALREQFGQVGATSPTFERVNRGANNTLVVKFKGVNRTQAMMAGPSHSYFSLPGGMTNLRLSSGSATQNQNNVGLQPDRHIAGFSIRGADGKEVPLIHEATVGPSLDAVILKLVGKVPEGASLWYGWGLDPYCNLVDSADMAVPAFGPIPLEPTK